MCASRGVLERLADNHLIDNTAVTPLNRNRWNLNIEATLSFQLPWELDNDSEFEVLEVSG